MWKSTFLEPADLFLLPLLGIDRRLSMVHSWWNQNDEDLNDIALFLTGFKDLVMR